MIRENVCDTAVEKDIDRAWKNYPKGFVAFLQEGEVPPDGQGLAQYLAKYVVSPPISVRRIEGYAGKTFSTAFFRELWQRPPALPQMRQRHVVGVDISSQVRYH